jgi:cytidylate kinase
MNKVICIDGPAASGKSTVSKLIAEMSGIKYVDSGALYRIATWQALEAGIDTNDAEAVAKFITGLKVDFVVKGNRVAYEVNGEEPGDKISTPEINKHVSPVSAVPEVRTIVTKWLRDMRSVGDIVVEGRDIGSVVYPDSPYRFYLDADAETRTARRYKEDIQKGFIQNADQVKASLLNRDKIDSSRKTAPLKIPEGAIVIDTSPLTAEQVAAKIIELSK